MKSLVGDAIDQISALSLHGNNHFPVGRTDGRTDRITNGMLDSMADEILVSALVNLTPLNVTLLDAWGVSPERILAYL